MRRQSARWFVLAGLAFAVLLVVAVAPFASSAPDGLERIAIDQGFADTASSSSTADSPLAGYGDGALSTAVAGVVGIAATFAFGLGGLLVLRRLRSSA